MLCSLKLPSFIDLSMFEQNYNSIYEMPSHQFISFKPVSDEADPRRFLRDCGEVSGRNWDQVFSWWVSERKKKNSKYQIFKKKNNSFFPAEIVKLSFHYFYNKKNIYEAVQDQFPDWKVLKVLKTYVNCILEYCAF